MFNSIAAEAMNKVWGHQPIGYQQVVIPHILEMMANVRKPQAVLLVQSTGSDKSAVPQTLSVVNGGLTIVIENTLSLGSDQTAKIVNANEYSGGRILSFQLDEVKNIDLQKRLSNRIIELLESNTAISIILFSSPEVLMTKIWTDMLCVLLRKKLLRLLCIDEVHLFVEFGLTFRKCFLQMKHIIFDKLKSMNGALHIPILFMTATFNLELKSLLTQMTGVDVHPYNICWGILNSFNRRNIAIELKYTNQLFRFVKNSIINKIKDRPKSKAIIFSNVARKIELMKQKIDEWLDSAGEIIGDTVLVIGDHETELKIAYTTAFTSSTTDDDQVNENAFYPRFLLGTPGCIGAGIDCDLVNLVCCLGMSTSVLNLIQEMGRCGRKRYDTQDMSMRSIQDSFCISFSIEDYVYLNQRLYIIDEDEDNGDVIANDTNEEGSVNDDGIGHDNRLILTIDEERGIQQKSIQAVARLFTLRMGCWHSYLEYNSGNPYQLHTYRSVPCINLCPHCDGSLKK